jgi:hypothetical protein
MRNRSLKCALALSCGLLAAAAYAAPPTEPSKNVPFADADHAVYFLAQGVKGPSAKIQALNPGFHGGPVMSGAVKVVYIFWGPSFNNAASPDFAYAQELRSFRDQFGTTPEYNTITTYPGITLSNLGTGTPDWFDTSTPPTNVTDSAVRSKVNAYLATHTFDSNTIYEVVIPSTSYSSSGTSTSCGGPSLAYCAYHSWIGSGTSAIKYSIEPYPSCAGCKVSGLTAAHNAEHFVCHETRETVLDPTGLGWVDGSGNEPDDKCAWSPTPFLGTGGYGYQYEWPNGGTMCIRTRPL